MIDLVEMRKRLQCYLPRRPVVEWVQPCPCGQRPAEFDGLCSWCSLFAAVRR